MVHRYIRWVRHRNGIQITEQSHTGRQFSNAGDIWRVPTDTTFRVISNKSPRCGKIHPPDKRASARTMEVMVRGTYLKGHVHFIKGEEDYLDKVENAFVQYNIYHSYEVERLDTLTSLESLQHDFHEMLETTGRCVRNLGILKKRLDTFIKEHVDDDT